MLRLYETICLIRKYALVAYKDKYSYFVMDNKIFIRYLYCNTKKHKIFVFWGFYYFLAHGFLLSSLLVILFYLYVFKSAVILSLSAIQALALLLKIPYSNAANRLV